MEGKITSFLIKIFTIYQPSLLNNFLVFCYSYRFPFLFLGIGSDDAFIIYNTWYNMSKEATNMPYIDLYYNVLKHASIAILVTCITTVAAFLTSIDSKITAVACFR